MQESYIFDSETFEPLEVLVSQFQRFLNIGRKHLKVHLLCNFNKHSVGNHVAQGNEHIIQTAIVFATFRHIDDILIIRINKNRPSTAIICPALLFFVHFILITQLLKSFLTRNGKSFPISECGIHSSIDCWKETRLSFGLYIFYGLLHGMILYIETNIALRLNGILSERSLIFQTFASSCTVYHLEVIVEPMDLFDNFLFFIFSSVLVELFGVVLYWRKGSGSQTSSWS